MIKLYPVNSKELCHFQIASSHVALRCQGEVFATGE